jgi:8-oxo-dGTP diphosphatase
MLKLLYGTGNPAKLDAMREWLSELPILISGLDEHAPPVPEDGFTPLENARQKALCYYSAYLRPVFSCDSGLVLSKVPEEKNPGVHARRPGGKPLSDEEMLAYYAGLVREYGRDGFLPARYQNAICLVMDGGVQVEYDGDDICSDTFLLADKPHPMRTPGWPLDSLSVSMQAGKYWFDMSTEE